MSDLHVVFGTGPIGLATVDELLAHGHDVRVVNRSGRADVAPEVEVVAGDASDPDVATAAASGAAVVYQCLNPAYHQWAEAFPKLQEAVIRAARSADARLVSFENLYMYGDTHGAPMSETTATAAHTRKGRVRRAMAEQLRSLHEAGRLSVATARASDYFGPRSGLQSPLGDMVIGAALQSKPARVIGDPDQPHSYTYTVDAGRTLAALGTRGNVLGEVYHVPNAPAMSTRGVIDTIADEIGSPIKISATPRWLLRAIGVLNPTVRELDEMLYEFTQPFLVDSSKAEQELGITPTPMSDSIAATVAWFREAAPTADR